MVLLLCLMKYLYKAYEYVIKTLYKILPQIPTNTLFCKSTQSALKKNKIKKKS